MRPDHVLMGFLTLAHYPLGLLGGALTNGHRIAREQSTIAVKIDFRVPLY